MSIEMEDDSISIGLIGSWIMVALSQHFSKVKDPRGDGGNTTISIESVLCRPVRCLP